MQEKASQIQLLSIKNTGENITVFLIENNKVTVDANKCNLILKRIECQ